MHARVTAFCKLKVVFPGTSNFAHGGILIPKFVPESMFTEFVLQLSIHCVKFGRVVFPVE